MRFEKPHSLSYHELTFTRRPDTFVSVPSKFDDAGLWLKSNRHQRCRVVRSDGLQRTLRRLPSGIALTSSTVVSRLAMNDRSTIDTLIVGTRMA